MKTKIWKKKSIIGVLALALTLALAVVGLLAIEWNTNSNKIAELSENDFEFNYVASLTYRVNTEETSGGNGVYGWGYQPEKNTAEYAYITGIKNTELADLKANGVTKLVLNIPATHGGVPVRYVAQDAFYTCDLSIVDINMPLSVYWQIKGNEERFTFDNNFAYARADGETATFTKFNPKTGSGVTTLILPSNVWIDKDSDGSFDDDEPTYRYTEYLFKSESNAAYKNLVVMPDVVNIFNGQNSSSDDRPKMQGGLLSKSESLESVYFCTGRSQVLHLYPLTFENCTALKEISLSAGVYLEDGARVFQGASLLEKFYIADEKTASARLFYVVGADGALYTNNYAYSYFTQSNTERYYEWWKNGLTNVGDWEGSYTLEWTPTKAWDNQTDADSMNLSDPTNPAQQGTFKGEAGSVSTPTNIYYATQNGDETYNSGVGIPEGSYVFDVNGTSKNGDVVDNLDDFEKGSGAGQYPTDAKFTSTTLTTSEKENSNGTTATLPVGSDSIKVTEKGGNTQSPITVSINDVEYKSRMQFKQGSTRYLKIEVPFDFDLCAYFAGNYEAAAAGDANPQIALFGSDTFNESNYSNKSYVGSKAKTAKSSSAIATLSDVNELLISGEAEHLLKIEENTLKRGTYYIAQPADDEKTSDYAQLLFLVITPSEKQGVASLEVQQDIDPSDGVMWEPIQNDALLFKWVTDELYTDLRHPSIMFNTKDGSLTFRVKALASNGETVRSQDINWALMDVNGKDVSVNFHMYNSTEPKIDADGYFTFRVRLEEVFDSGDLYNEQQKHGRNFAIKLTAGEEGKEVTKYIYINLMPDVDETAIPDANQWQESYTSGTEPRYLSITEEKSSRYQTLVSMPAMAKNDAGDYVNSFDFIYHETMEIGPNAFQNTYITVIDIPDRIAKIGASAFRFSSHLQTVYLPDDADIGLNAFGQEADASPQDGTVYTAGKKNFFLIAPSRTSFEHYLMYAAKYYELGQKEQYEANYNVFPAHVESEEMGFQDWGGKDASYDYTPYLTYEITVNFLTYDSTGSTLKGTQTRTFLYGMDARFVKATATTEWANFDQQYDNNAPVYFGRIQNSDTVQQINTISTKISWSIAADGWYYDENVALPEGSWYFGNMQVTDSADETTAAKDFTEFFGGWQGASVNDCFIQNLVQMHYAAVYDATDTSDVKAVTETGAEANDLRTPIVFEPYPDDRSHGDFVYELEFPEHTSWNRWVWDEKFNDNAGAVVQKFYTMPFAITLKNISQNRENTIEFDVPTFQNIGTITNDEDTVKAVLGADDSWKVPMLTVTFDYNGFPASRIFENFKSGAMEVSYTAWRGRSYYDKEWRWVPYSYSSSAEWDDYEDMRHIADGEYVPYDVGYYRVTVKFSANGLDYAQGNNYSYRWSGVYNGMRVDEDEKAEFTFILHIEPRKVPISNIYSMQYTGQGFSLFEDNPYVDVVRYGTWNWDHGDYTADGLPCAVGLYSIKLLLHDPKYPSPSPDSGYPEYTPNLEWEGTLGYNHSYGYTEFEESEGVSKYVYSDGVDLFIFDGNTEVTWGSLYEDSDEGDKPVKFTSPLAIFNSEVQTYTYTGAPIPIEDVFGGVFSSSSINYTITRNGKTVTEINNAGTYTVSITPAEGYVWWRGIPSVDYKATFRVNKWSLDEFWAKHGGYESNKTVTLTFEVNVDKRPVTVPRDSYVPTEAELYEFVVPIDGDYEVMGYHLHDFNEDATIPKAVDTSAWSTDILEPGVYDVLLRLTDPENTTWAPDAGESHGDNYYVTARLYAGFDREKTYPAFKSKLGDTTGNHSKGNWVTLTRTYDGNTYSLDDLFDELRPNDIEAKYTIYKLSEKPDSYSMFTFGDEVEAIGDAGYYGITVILNDPFLYKDTSETEAYYIVNIENATITRNGDDSFWNREKIFSADDLGTELKLPDDYADYPLNIVSLEANGVNVTYHLEKYGENEVHDVKGNLDKLNKGESVFPDWYEYSDDLLKVKTPGGYWAYIKVEAPNHETYYDCISLHIYNEEFEFTLSATEGTAVYGESVHTQEALRKAVFDVATSINIQGKGNIPTKTVDIGTLDKSLFHFYFMKDGEEYDFGTDETYLDVGEYELHVRYNWSVGSPEEGKNYITFSWAGGNPKFTVTQRELTLDLGTITGHTYLEMSPKDWHTKEDFTYKDTTLGAIVSRNGVADDLQLSYQFKLGENTFSSLNAISNAGEYSVEVTCGNSNYKVKLNDTYTYTVLPRQITLDPVASVSYDGQEHKPNISFKGLPEKIVLLEGTDKNYTLDYTPIADAQLGDTGLPLTAGSYTVTVTLVSTNYIFADGANCATETFVIEMTGSFVLNGIEFEDMTVEYDGQSHKLQIEGDLPEGVTVTYVGDNGYDSANGATMPGVYIVTAIFRDNLGTEIARKTAILTIEESGLLKGVTFEDETVSYDGNAHSIYAQGIPENVSVTYENNGQTLPGVYIVTAIFRNNAGTEIARKTAILTIEESELLKGVTFEDETVSYDGNAHNIYAQGIPDGVSVTYENNGQTKPGVYTVTAIFSDSAGEFARKSATLTILAVDAQFTEPDGTVTVVVTSEAGVDPSWRLVVEKSYNLNRTLWIWEKDTLSVRYSVKFVHNGELVPLEGKVIIRLLIPEEIKDKEFTLKKVGSTENIEYERDRGYVVFEADGLSDYEFVCVGSPYLPVILINSGISVVGVAILVVLMAVIKKNKKGE